MIFVFLERCYLIFDFSQRNVDGVFDMAFQKLIRFADVEYHDIVVIHFGDRDQGGNAFVFVKGVGQQILDQQKNDAHQRESQQIMVSDEFDVLIHCLVLLLRFWKLAGLFAAKNVAHHLDEMYYAVVVDKVKDAIGFFLVIENAFVPQYRQMLGDVALTRANLFDDILDADRLIAEDAQYF